MISCFSYTGFKDYHFDPEHIQADLRRIYRHYYKKLRIPPDQIMVAHDLKVCPKKLTGNWTIYQASQNHALNPLKKDRLNYTVLYHTDMGRESGRSAANGIDLENFNWGAYDLVVIDESHRDLANPVQFTNSFVAALDPYQKVGLLVLISVIFIVLSTSYPRRSLSWLRDRIDRLLSEKTVERSDEVPPLEAVMNKHPDWDRRVLDRLVMDIEGVK